MVNPKLKAVIRYVDSWCEDHDIVYNIVCDESDIQGVLLFRKDRELVAKLLNALEPVLEQNRIHLETKKVRGGTILAFSVRALSESQLAAMIAEAGEEIEPMTFKDRIADALSRTVVEEPAIESAPELNEGYFLVAAAKIAESQFKSATDGATRANQTSLQRQRVGSNRTLGGVEKTPSGEPVHGTDDPQATTGASQAGKGPPARFESRLSRIFNTQGSGGSKSFERALNETLNGMATPDGAQPGDLFQKFAHSLAVLGQQMGIGPLQDQLKQQGINWKKSDDGQSIVLYIVNAQTKAPQPIARISAETLTKPSDFESQLLNIMDFAKGDAPGTFKMKQQEAQAQEKAVREIAKSMGPQDPNAVAQQMQGGQPQQPMQQPQPMQQAAPPAAAQQAAMPKQPMAGGLQ